MSSEMLDTATIHWQADATAPSCTLIPCLKEPADETPNGLEVPSVLTFPGNETPADQRQHKHETLLAAVRKTERMEEWEKRKSQKSKSKTSTLKNAAAFLAVK